MEASVVDLPLPVAPDKRTRPFSRFANLRIAGGKSRSSIDGISEGIVLKTAETPKRVLKALTRKRALSPKDIAISESNRAQSPPFALLS